VVSDFLHALAVQGFSLEPYANIIQEHIAIALPICENDPNLSETVATLVRIFHDCDEQRFSA
jgi:hypothetical protein